MKYIKECVVQNTQKLYKKQECCSKIGKKAKKNVVPNMEQQNQKVLFRRWNSKTKKCCSEDGTTKPKIDVLNMEQQNQKVLFRRWNNKMKK